MKSYMVPAEHHTAVQRALHLGRSGDAAALPELIALLKLPSNEVQRLAASAIGKLAGFGADIDAAVAALAPLALGARHPQTQQYAIRTLKAYAGAAQPCSPLPQRKHPVHMAPVARHNDPVVLFVTFAIQPREPNLANMSFRDAFVAACGDADAWSVGFYLIMPDHVHLFCRPARLPEIGIKRWSRYLKERITKRLRIIMAQNGSAQPRPPGIDSPQVRPPRVRSGLMEGEVAPSRLLWKWQPDCWDTQLRSVEHYHERWEYVRQNPVRGGLTNRPDDWPWQGVLNVIEW